MASSLTYKGEEYALFGDGASDGSIARKATSVRLYQFTGAAPVKAGTGLVEVAGANGYTAGGIAITVGDWTYTSAPSQIALTSDPSWTAAGGAIADIGGAYIVDGSGNILAWWERSSALTLDDGDSLTLDDLTIRFP